MMDGTIKLSERDLVALLTNAAQAGAARIAATLAPTQDLITQNEAYRTFGRRTVEQWVERGYITPRRLGEAANSRRAYSLAELRSLTAAIDTSSMILNRRYNK